jgi:predicted GH43/DUF377 family glycosyl hydrolase
MPTSSPSASEASVSFSFEAEPVVTRDLAGSTSRYVNPGAIIAEGERLHMYPNLFTSWPGPIDIPHLTSDDGRSWALADATPIFATEDVPFAMTGVDASTGLVLADGTWMVVFETVENGRPWVLGRATAPGPDGPWTVDPEPILEPGPAGSWDAAGLSWPSIIATDDGYAMYFTGIDRPRGTSAIGLASSTDGKIWTKDDGPVLEASAPWEGSKLDRPRVSVTPRGLAMVYAGARLTDRGLAWSEDGINWQRDGSAPVIDQDRFPVDGRAWDAALQYRDGALLYYLEIGSAGGASGTLVYLARAPLG